MSQSLFLLLLIGLLLIGSSSAFQKSISLVQRNQNQQLHKRLVPLRMEFELNTYTYGLIFLATLVPSIAIGISMYPSSMIVNSSLTVNFVGKQADNSRDKLSTSTRDRFKRSLLEQGAGSNFANPTAEEEAIKRQIAKAYREDKDVDVAILEEKLRERAKWRKELQAQLQAKSRSGESKNEPEDEGW